MRDVIDSLERPSSNRRSNQSSNGEMHMMKGGLGGLMKQAHLSVCYAFLYTLLALLRYKTSRQRLAASACLIPALFIYLFSGWLGIPVPLSDGWMPEAYLGRINIRSVEMNFC